MARALSLLPLALLFLASAVPSHGQKAGASAGGGGGGAEREVAVREGAPLTVECPLRPEQRVEWRRDGGPAPADLARGEAAAAPGAGAGAGGLTARLSAPAARPHHAGVYTCARDPPRARLRVRLLPAAAAGPGPGPGPATAPLPAPTTVEGAAAAGAEAGAAGDGVARAGEMPEVKGTLVEFEVRPSVFLINCSDLYRPGEKLEWSKNGSSLETWADTRTRLAAEGGVLKLAGGTRAAETDHGYYRCEGASGARDFTLRALPVAKLNDDSSVVEGQKLKLTCRLTGLPYPPVVWTYSNTSDTVENGTDALEAFGGRAALRDWDRGSGVLVRGGELVLEPAARTDAGWLRCAPQGARLARQAAVTRLRVKDMYAALWPFLGICAEVFVLCAIILLYERRRTKPELEDSDTDNHDQVVEAKESVGPAAAAVRVPLQPPPEPEPEPHPPPLPPLPSSPPTPGGADPPPPSGKKS